jgi:multiple antibiotic resistance protein
LSELFVSAFVTFLVVIDPPGCAPIFASLTSGTSAAHRRATALRSVAIASGILIFFGLLGQDLLHMLGVSLTAFRETRAEEVSAAHVDDISVFPMAIPMIAGPGSIASIMLMTARSEGLTETLIVMGALLLTLLLTLVALLLAGPLMRLMGHRMEAMLTRLLGVILAALAVQFVLDGLHRSFT